MDDEHKNDQIAPTGPASDAGEVSVAGPPAEPAPPKKKISAREMMALRKAAEEGDAEAQARRCFEIILAAVEQLGGTAADVVRTRMFLVDAADAEAVGRAHQAVFGEARPAATMVVVAGLLRPEWRVEIEAEAVLGGGG